MTPDRALCLVCGRSADVVGESLDPGHPLVDCAWRDPEGVSHGHGRRIGTRSQDESDAIQIAKREKRQEQAHTRGAHEKGRWPFCPICQAKAAAKLAGNTGPNTGRMSRSGETHPEVKA